MNGFDEFGNPIKNIDVNKNTNFTDPNNEFIAESESEIISEEKDDIIDYEFQVEDAQPISLPIIPMNDNYSIDQNRIEDKNDFYLQNFLKDSTRIYNICLVGNLLHGKTEVFNMFLRYAYYPNYEEENKPENYNVEAGEIKMLKETNKIDRKISIDSTFDSIVVKSLKKNTFLYNLVDTPGHTDLIDETLVAGRLCDNSLICVSVVLGPQKSLERIFQNLIKEGNSNFLLCITNLDKLILDQKLPPSDSYNKIKWVIDCVNIIYLKTCKELGMKYELFSPRKNNVIFCCSIYNFSFTLETFAKIYLTKLNSKKSRNSYEIDIDYKDFALYLWGDIFYDDEKNEFYKEKLGSDKLKILIESDKQNTFVTFVLEPLYKLFSISISYNGEKLIKALKEFRVALSSEQTKKSQKEILKLVFDKFFSGSEGLISAIQSKGITSFDGSKIKIDRFYPKRDDSYQLLMDSSVDSPVTVLFSSKKFFDCKTKKYSVLARVVCGRLILGDKITVLDENHVSTNISHSKNFFVNKIFLTTNRKETLINVAYPHNIIMIEDVETDAYDCYTFINSNKVITEILISPFKKLSNFCAKHIYLSCEPLDPKTLPIFLESLRNLNKTLPGITINIQENGIRNILGQSEFILDLAMETLRKQYTDIEINSTGPSCKFNETILQNSFEITKVSTINQNCEISFIGNNLDSKLKNDLEMRNVDISDCDSKDFRSILEAKYNFDILSAKSIWCFANDNIESILINDISPSLVSTERNDSYHYKDQIIQGFQWGVSEGPIIEEPIRHVIFRMIGLKFKENNKIQIPNQLILATRKAVHDTVLNSEPRLLEPVMMYNIIVASDNQEKINKILDSRRGKTIASHKIPATDFVNYLCLIPAIDSFGAEVDFKLYTFGEAHIESFFCKWDVLNGDPFDENIKLNPLEVTPLAALPREIFLKIRRRKGLTKKLIEPNS